MLLNSEETLNIAVIGGDRRETAAAAYLQSRGANVRIYGPPWNGDEAGVVEAKSLGQAVEGVRLIVGPVRGIDQDNHLYGPQGTPGLWLTRTVLDRVSPDALFFIGKANAWLREQAHDRGFSLVEILERNDFAILNAIPTAEGAIAKAMEESDITIFESTCMVLGFGRTGQTLAKSLQGLGGRVMTVCRRAGELARACACGYRPVEFRHLADTVEEADFIFNTVPDLVLDRGILGRTKKEVVIVDIATAPGGTDFEAAEAFRRQAYLVPGLPGKVAPRTAGRYLGQVVWQVTMEMLAVPGLTP